MTDTGDARIDGPMDPELLETEQRVHGALRSGQLRPAFEDRLRAELVAAVPVTTGPTAVPTPLPTERPAAVEPTRSSSSGATRWRRRVLVPAIVGTAAAAVAGAVIVDYHRPVPVGVAASSDVNGAVSADPAAPVRIRFARPVDHAATVNALRLSPASLVRTSWQGDTLTIAPAHSFAANAAYVITVAGSVARTASGATFAADLNVVFGTAATTEVGRAVGTPVGLPRTRIAGAEDGSEAAVAQDGSLLLTGAQPGAATGYQSGLVHITGSGPGQSGQEATRLAPATDAICVSRSGDSVAFLALDAAARTGAGAGTGTGTEIVFADATGTAQRRVPATVDDGSPLGWIGDGEVTFVSDGHLVAVDRTGRVRSLPAGPLDAAKGALVISPGGRYAYAAAAGSVGRLVDLSSGDDHPLPGIVGEPAFSADGATVVWIDGSSPTPRLASAASSGGPVHTAQLPVSVGDRISDLSVSPEGGQVAYSVTRTSTATELRVASLSDGQTIGVSTAGAGASPNWARSGRSFTVLSSRPDGTSIDLVTVPRIAAARTAAVEAAAAGFANAQVSADVGAQQALAVPGASLPAAPSATRAAVLWVTPVTDTTATARIRLTRDARPDDPVIRSVEESVTFVTDPGSGAIQVSTVEVGASSTTPPGPELSGVDTDVTPGSVVLTFNSDLDPASATTSTIMLSTRSGTPIPATVRYDPEHRTVAVRPDRSATGPARIRIGTAVRTYDGRTGAHPVDIDVMLHG
jgi:hypothetical protein